MPPTTAATKMKKAQYISDAEATTILETKTPKGIFIVKNKKYCTAIDNSTGDAWTEDFRTEEECLKWLNREESQTPDTIKHGHTAGVWKMTKKEGNYIIHSDQEQNCLAIVGTGVFNTDPLKWNEAEANARLMAASKYMLTALQAIQARISGEYDHPALLEYGLLSANESEDIEGYCSDAIRKATSIF